MVERPNRVFSFENRQNRVSITADPIFSLKTALTHSHALNAIPQKISGTVRSYEQIGLQIS